MLNIVKITVENGFHKKLRQIEVVEDRAQYLLKRGLIRIMGGEYVTELTAKFIISQSQDF